MTLYITPVYYYYMEKLSRRLNRDYGSRFSESGGPALPGRSDSI